MAFPAEIFRSSIPLIDLSTKGIQCKITHFAWIGQDIAGNPVYDDPVELECVLDRTNKQITRGDQTLDVVATLMFVGDIAPNGTATNPPRREPIDTRDKIILPDGVTGPIIDSPNAPIDPETIRGFYNEVMMGS